MVSVKASPQGAPESRPAHPGNPTRTIGFFGHDWTESTVVKRVRALQAHDTRVIGFMFRRAQRTPPATVPWENIELGTTVDRHYLLRLAKLFMGIFTLLRHRRSLRECQVYYARNIDMLVLAVVAKTLVRSPAPVVYEVLDIQRVFLGGGLVNKAFRRAERLLMRHAAMLVVSSPDFISEYFLPYQRYAGPWRLLENKVLAAQAISASPPSAGSKPPGPPWIIGWFGTLRCARSLEILGEIADASRDNVIVSIRGLPSEEDLTIASIEAACAGRNNMLYGGSYKSPQDLASIYGHVHFAWCIDYLDAGANSDWLLPNRVYEGGLMGCVAIARTHTATARMVDRLGLGWTFEEPLASTVSAFLAQLATGTYQDAQRRVAATHQSTFVDLTDTRDLLDDIDKLTETQRQRAGLRHLRCA
jgi:succinoglycan biosynthesis protein ExoL